MSEQRLIDANALKKAMDNKALDLANGGMIFIESINHIIDNAPTVEPEKAKEGELVKAYTKGFDAGVETARPQGEYVDISKLRLMTVEECAGHTIEYAMGWKACVEWIKKGGAE